MRVRLEQPPRIPRWLAVGQTIVLDLTQLLLLPVVYSLIGPSGQLLLGLLTGAVVFAAFMLLISERSRAWSMGAELDDR